jgi:DNA-binding CsgD family transcriptional regulator
MAQALPSPVAPRSVFALSLRVLPDPPPGLDDPVLVRRWLVEVWLVRARWWAALLAALGLYAGAPRSTAPALLAVPLLLAAGRYGVPGLAAGSAAAAVALAGLLTAQATLLGVLGWAVAVELAISWGLFLATFALAVYGLTRANAAWRAWELARWDRDDADLRRIRCGLSAREAELLPLLARPELTYQQIAHTLCISPTTVKTHVQRLGTKLGATGRSGVVAAARERDLLH